MQLKSTNHQLEGDIAIDLPGKMAPLFYTQPEGNSFFSKWILHDLTIALTVMQVEHRPFVKARKQAGLFPDSFSTVTL